MGRVCLFGCLSDIAAIAQKKLRIKYQQTERFYPVIAARQYDSYFSRFQLPGLREISVYSSLSALFAEAQLTRGKLSFEVVGGVQKRAAKRR